MAENTNSFHNIILVVVWVVVPGRGEEGAILGWL